MSTPHEVACSFIPAFFELLATNPAGVSEMYSPKSSFLVVDYEYGMSEARGADVFKAVEQWAQIVQGCQLSVDNYTAEALHCGVCVYVSLTATSESVRHFFQFVTVLEGCSLSACDAETYFIRHQVITRPGSIAVEPPEEPESAEEKEALEEKETVEEKEPVEEPEPVEIKEAAAAEAPKKTPTPKRSPAPAHTADAEKAAGPPKPKTWASLASAAPTKTEPRAPVKVISAGNGSKNDLTEAAAAPRKEPKDAAAAAKPYVKGPRNAAPAAVGDRLMFNVDDTVSDDDVRSALGPWAAHVVSLRNNSKKGGGYVFLDFAPNEKVLDALKENPPAIGPNKIRINVYRQKPRE